MKAALASFLTLWLSTFAVLSTSHLGHPHHLNPTPGYYEQNCHDPAHKHLQRDCIWALGQISTLGEIPAGENSNWDASSPYTLPEKQSFSTPLDYNHPPSRAPPGTPC